MNNAPYLILCRPTAVCAQRNECYRYRATPDTTSKYQDFTDRPDGLSRCWGRLPLYESDDDLSPIDWQEPRGPCTT